MRTPIKTFEGHIMGWLEPRADGQIYALSFTGRILARYNPKDGFTRSYTGKILGRGDLTAAQIQLNYAQEQEKRKQSQKVKRK